MADERGFTLLEVMVALVILVLALSSLYQSLGIGVDGAERIDRDLQAVETVEAFVAELGRSRPLRTGVTEGELSSGQHWRLAVAATEPPPAASAVSARTILAVTPYSVTLTIDRPRQRHAATLVVRTILLGPPQ